MGKALPQRYAQLHDTIRKSNAVLIATHEQADGDAMGSLIALAESIPKKPDVRVVMLAPKSSVAQYSFLDRSEKVLTDAGPIRADEFDCIVLLDCGNVHRTHVAQKLYFLEAHRPTVALIDHHPVEIYADGRTIVDIEMVRTGASSTCELVYEYLMHNGIPITPLIANALLTGIVTDTGGFQNHGTTYESMEIAGELLKRGANLRRIVRGTMRNKSVSVLRLWGRALSRLEYDPTTRIVSTALRTADFEECGVAKDGVEGIANFLNGLADSDVVLVLREEAGGFVKGSYRTKKSDVDVAVLARRFGGGGHVKAAGFTVRGSIERHENGWVVQPLGSEEKRK
ncbi:MAG: bifunctional oligoribonuclease/PAP phosphatase NrnA [Candidatus Kerfeldbacteria bacterium]